MLNNSFGYGAAVVLLLFGVCSASASRIPGTTEIEARDARAIYVATKEWQRTHENFECFVVDFRAVEDGTEVSFIPKQPDEIDPSQRGIVYLGGRTPCGQGVSYIVDKRGHIVRKIYSR